MNNLRNGSKYDGTSDSSFTIYRKVGRTEMYAASVYMTEEEVEKMDTTISRATKYWAETKPVEAEENKNTLISIAREKGLSGNLVFKTSIREGSEVFNNKVLIKGVA